MQPILVAGGAGFIGSHLCKKLLDNKKNVLCLDNLYTGNKKNIDNLIKNNKFKFIKHNVVKSINLKTTEIYNLACPASPIQYQNNPVETIRTNVIGSINLLELARKNNSKILQASTSEVYGDPEVHPQSESYWGKVNPIGIRSCYDEGKRCAETLFFDYFRQFNLKIKVVRIFNTYGPNMLHNDGRVISNFIVQALKGENIKVHGNGNQTRSFCYIDDLIKVIISMMKTKNSFTGPVNIGSDDEYTIAELADIILKLTKSKSKIIYIPLPEDDPKRRRPDISKAKKIFNWKPEISLEDGLKETIFYFKNNL